MKRDRLVLRPSVPHTTKGLTEKSREVWKGREGGGR